MTHVCPKTLAERLRDAFSTANYQGGWKNCIKMLRKRGYNDTEIEAIIRSKWTRWAAASSGKRYGYNTSTDLAGYLDDPSNGCTQEEVSILVRETFGK